MHHNGPSGNDSSIGNFKNKHLLKEDFGTSVNELHMVEHQATFVMSIDNGVRNDCTISQANQGMHYSEQRDTLKNGITNAGGK
jgi:hypothetical protein